MKETGRREVTGTGTIIAAGETGQDLDLDLGTVVMTERDAAIETPGSATGVGAHRGDRAETMTENPDARAAREDEAQIGTRRDGEETEEVLAMKENHEDTEIEQARTNGVKRYTRNQSFILRAIKAACHKISFKALAIYLAAT